MFLVFPGNPLALIPYKPRCFYLKALSPLRNVLGSWLGGLKVLWSEWPLGAGLNLTRWELMSYQLMSPRSQFPSLGWDTLMCVLYHLQGINPVVHSSDLFRAQPGLAVFPRL